MAAVPQPLPIIPLEFAPACQQHDHPVAAYFPVREGAPLLASLQVLRAVQALPATLKVRLSILGSQAAGV
jgi:hypothetical protein